MEQEREPVRLRIVPFGSGFAIETDGSRGAIAYVTKEAAFEALAASADAAIGEGRGVEIIVPAGAGAMA
jgi:hypothetical protein